MSGKKQKIRELLRLVDSAQSAGGPQALDDDELVRLVGLLINSNNTYGRAHLPYEAREVLEILDNLDARRVADGYEPMVRPWTEADELAALDAEIEREEATIAMHQRVAGYSGGSQQEALEEKRRRRAEMAAAASAAQ